MKCEDKDHKNEVLCVAEKLYKGFVELEDWDQFYARMYRIDFSLGFSAMAIDCDFHTQLYDTFKSGISTVYFKCRKDLPSDVSFLLFRNSFLEQFHQYGTNLADVYHELQEKQNGKGQNTHRVGAGS